MRVRESVLAAACAALLALAQHTAQSQQPALPSAAGASPAVPAGNANTAAPPAGTVQRAPAPAPSAPIYNVELIVFRANSALGAAEDWASEAAHSGITPQADADTVGAAAAEPAAPSHFVRALAPADFQLNELESHLRASGAYTPIAHVGWSQTASPWGDHAGIPLQVVGVEAAGLSGSVSLERGQFLHLGLALNFEMPNPPAGLAPAGGAVFTIHELHRVRFYERNYFDNPAFGAIALVTPVQGARRAGR